MITLAIKFNVHRHEKKIVYDLSLGFIEKIGS